MSTLCTPENINPLNPNGFLFSVQKLPEVTFFVQEVELPTLSIGTVIQATQVHDIKIPGETAEFDNLQMSFLVDENFKNWKAIYAWLIGLTYPESHDIYTSFLNSERNANSRTELAKGYSDGTLTILDSSNNPVQSIQFVDMYPTSLSALPFSSQNTDVQYLRASVNFAYSYYRLVE
jgi:hypothetical protein